MIIWVVYFALIVYFALLCIIDLINYCKNCLYNGFYEDFLYNSFLCLLLFFQNYLLV